MKLHPAYAAGLFDGEGAVTLNRRSDLPDGFKPRVQISITAAGITQALHDTYGGFIYQQRPQQVHWAPYYTWVCANAPAVKVFFSAIWPYALVKRDAIAVVTYILPTYDKTDRAYRQAIDRKPWWGLSEEARRRRRWAKETLGQLNRRGIKDVVDISEEVYEFADNYLTYL